MVALSNPRTESALVSLAAVWAKHHDGRVLAIHIVQVPDQTALSAAAKNRERIDAESAELLATANADAEAAGVPIETKTVLSHRGLAEVFDAARTNDADAELLVETGDVEAAIEAAAADHTLVVVGATERGLLARVVGGSLALSVLEDIETPVVLAERPTSRSLRERLFRRR